MDLVDIVAVADQFFQHYQNFLKKHSDNDEISNFYIHRATNLRTFGDTHKDFNSEPKADQIDPFILLTGFSQQELTHNNYQKQEVATSPYLALLVGQYGTGKTELSYRLCQFLRKFKDNGTKLRPLPINLSFFRRHRNLLDRKSNNVQFFQTLFGEILSNMKLDHSDTSTKTMSDRLQEHIHQGKLLLILDALDELIDEPARHRNFFAGLRDFLCREGIPQFKVLVTMRREYLASVGDLAGKNILTEFNPSKSPAQIYFMELDQFSEWEIKSYFRKRLPHLPDLFSKIANYDELLATLQRPLLLKLFSDLVPPESAGFEERESWQKNFDALFGSITEAAQLLGCYVDVMNNYVNYAEDYAKQEQKKLDVVNIWDNDKLARCCVELYKKRTNVLTKNDIEQIKKTKSNTSSLKNSEEPFLSIFKCPFLLKVDRDHVRFAHQVFLEFFIARGLALEAEESLDTAEDFNTLVLNRDIRKFLKFMLNTNEKLKQSCIEKFHEIPNEKQTVFRMLTWRSCGLLDPDEWSLPKEKFEQLLEKLDEVRFILGMTDPDPEKDDPSVAENIDWFLENENIGLHPKYLMYCHHAVAMHVDERRWRGESKQQNEKLREILQKRLEKVIDELGDNSEKPNRQLDSGLCKPLQLLAETILDIALRMRYDWVLSYAEDRTWLRTNWDLDSQERIEKILQTIATTVF